MRHLAILFTLFATLIAANANSANAADAASSANAPGAAMRLVDEPCPQIGTITVSVDAQNVIRLNGRKMSEEKFNAIFPQLASIVKEICYSRASPESYEPPPIAVAVYNKIINSKVPVTLYWDLEFKKKVVFKPLR
jgi:hypothetical protein